MLETTVRVYAVFLCACKRNVILAHTFDTGDELVVVCV